MTRRGAVALTALALIAVITAAWWALALWPTAADGPAWVERTRAVCFGVTNSGLPSIAGWIVLIGEPLGMLGFLLFVWGEAVSDGLRALRRSLPGRAALALTLLLVVLGLAATGVRVANANEAGQLFLTGGGEAAAPERLDRPAPPLALVDQYGDTVRLQDFRGRRVLVVPAYGHCETVCPLIVHDAKKVLEGDPGATLLIVTLDPWRDTPSRLPYLAQSWQLPPGAHILSGAVETVERTLDAWGIARSRDERTGEILHPVSIYLIDRLGRLAYIAPSDPGRLAALLAGL
jgi:cytochrome oxidase Cu insertion factor (SCO1/SenC/PrrC family)